MLQVPYIDEQTRVEDLEKLRLKIERNARIVEFSKFALQGILASGNYSGDGVMEALSTAVRMVNELEERGY